MDSLDPFQTNLLMEDQEVGSGNQNTNGNDIKMSAPPPEGQEATPSENPAPAQITADPEATIHRHSGFVTTHAGELQTYLLPDAPTSTAPLPGWSTEAKSQEAKKVKKDVEECPMSEVSGLLPLQLGAEVNPLVKEGFTYTLDAPTSAMVRKGEDSLTYVNKGQFYGLTMEFTPSPNRQFYSTNPIVTSVVMLQFRKVPHYEAAQRHRTKNLPTKIFLLGFFADEEKCFAACSLTKNFLFYFLVFSAILILFIKFLDFRKFYIFKNSTSIFHRVVVGKFFVVWIWALSAILR